MDRLRMVLWGKLLNVIKFDTNCNFLWAKIIPTPINNTVDGKAVALDSNNDIYITGGSAFNLQTNLPGSNNNSQIHFVMKFDSSGNRIWTRTIEGTTTGSAFQSDGLAITSDADDCLYNVGLVEGDSSPKTFDGKSCSAYCYYILKYDKNGNKIFSAVPNSTAEWHFASSVFVDSQKNIYIYGEQRNYTVIPGQINNLLVKHNSTGSVTWRSNTIASQMNGTDDKTSIFVDSNGNIFGLKYTMYYWGAEVRGNWDSGLTKFDSNGNVIWSKFISTPNSDIAKSMSYDLNGNLYIVGTTNGSLNGNNNLGNYDGFLIKYDKDGNVK